MHKLLIICKLSARGGFEGFFHDFEALKSCYALYFHRVIGIFDKLFVFTNSSASDISSFYAPFVFNKLSGSTFILTFFCVRAS